jgi:hypothetical protein
MESTKHVTLVRYWNYVVSPIVVLTAFFGVYTLATLKSVQTMDTSLVADGIRHLKRRNGA